MEANAMMVKAEFVIGETWSLLVTCPFCKRVTATWSLLPEHLFQTCICWGCIVLFTNVNA